MAATTSHRAEASVLVTMRDIGKGIAATRDAMTFETDPEVLGDAICELVGLGTELDSLRVQLVTQCESNGVPESIGVRTMGQYVAARTNSSTKATDLDRRLAKWLSDYPLFAQALEHRDMTVEHLRYLRHKLDNVRTGSRLKGDQQIFVDLARDGGFSEFEKGCEYWVGRNDPDGKEPIDQLENAGAAITVGVGGRTKITIDSDAVTGHALTRMIEHEAQKIRKQDAANGITRTTRQRRSAAILALMERGFRREDGSHPIPLINLVMSQKVAEWAVAKLQSLGHDNCTCDFGDTVPIDPHDVDGRCEFIDGQPVHPLLVAAVLGLHRFDIPTMRRYVMTADSRILDYSYNARIPPEHVRTASHIEHRGACPVHGCDAPHPWLQMDHIDPHSNGGPTSLRNTEPKCEGDNLAKGAQTGHIPWKDRPLPKRHRPRRSADPDDPDDSA